eukprot:817282-Rhodomonas_salina.3
MYHRINTVGKLLRLPRTIGQYEDIPHERVHYSISKAAPEYVQAERLVEIAERQDEIALQQLGLDGLRQVCHYAEFIRSAEDPDRSLSTVTVDLVPTYASSCSDAAPNDEKLEEERKWREDVSLRGLCQSLLRDAVGFVHQRRVVLERRLCTDDNDFCVDAYSSPQIQANIARLDSIPFLPHRGPLASRAPFQEWARVVKPRMSTPLELGVPPKVGHTFMMGWNESMAYLRMLIRQHVPFAATRFSNGELSFLARQPLGGHSRWDPNGDNAELFRDQLVLPFVDARSPHTIMMLALPVAFCLEGWESNSDFLGGGGNMDALRMFFEPSRSLGSELQILTVPPERFLYQWQFGNLNYQNSMDLIETLGEAGWPLILVCRERLIEDKPTPPWADALLTVSESDEELRNLNSVLDAFEELAGSVNGTAFVFAIEDFGTAMISAMHRANARNIYMDVGAAWDYAISNKRTQEYHPKREDANHFVRAGGALRHGQACTETRWNVSGLGFFPVTE